MSVTDCSGEELSAEERTAEDLHNEHTASHCI